MRMLVAAAAAALTIPGAAAAEGWSVAELGDVSSVSVCMERAQAVAERADREYGTYPAEYGNGIVYIYDVSHDDYDAFINCTVGDAGGAHPVLVVYSVGSADSDKRLDIARTMRDWWDETR